MPQNDFVDEIGPEEDPRDELVQQLVQYSVFKKISAYFKERNEKVPITVSKEASVSKSVKVQPLPEGQITSDELAATFSMVIFGNVRIMQKTRNSCFASKRIW